MDYWKECVSEAFEDAGLEATDEQIGIVTSWVEGAHENYSLATGQEMIPNPLQSEIERIRGDHRREVEALTKEIDIYKSSVAERRRVSPTDVYTEDGQVYYG